MTTPFVCPTDHKHQTTSTCYTSHRCTCTDCRVTEMARRLERRRQVAFGRWQSPYADAAPARAHITAILDAGYTIGQISALAGVHYSTVQELIVGPRRPTATNVITRIRAENSEKLLALDMSAATLSSTALVSAVGAIRRIQALGVLGWSQAALGRQLDLRKQGMWQMLRQNSVSVAKHKRVADLYEELWNSPPPRTNMPERVGYTRSIRFAESRRWLPAMAWDDIDTDVEPPLIDVDPDYVDEVLVEVAMTGEAVRLTRAERLEALTRLNARHVTDGVIAELLHVDVRTVLRNRQELNLPAAVGYDQQPLIAA